MQVEEIVFRGKKPKKNRRISLLDDYYYQTPSGVANQSAGFALVHQLGDTNNCQSLLDTAGGALLYFFFLVQHFPLDTKYISLFPQTPYRDEEVRQKQGKVSTLSASSVFTFKGVGWTTKGLKLCPLFVGWSSHCSLQD